MAAAQDGDSKAYHQLLKEITPLLTNFIKKRVYDRNLVDDIVQNILMGIHKARHTYDIQKPFEPWMFAIARYKMIDALRSQGREISDTDNLETFLEEPSNTIEQRAERKDLIAALATLSDQNRTIVRMMKIEGYSAKEVAAETGMSVSAVKVAAHRAYKQLRAILEEK